TVCMIACFSSVQLFAKVSDKVTRMTTAALLSNLKYYKCWSAPVVSDQRGNIQKLLLGKIFKVTKSIICASFALTDFRIVHALVSAQDRGVRVTVIVDQTTAREKRDAVHALKKFNVP